MFSKQRALLIKRIAAVVFYLIVCISIFQLIRGLWQGTTPFLAGFKIDEPVVWTIFESEIKPISIKYPEDWIPENLPQGYGGDKEIIGAITPLHPDYPWVYIANRKMQTNILEAVAKWGESRLRDRKVDYTTISLEKIIVNGKEALLRKYYYLDYQPQRVDCYQVYLLDNSDAYVISMCVDEKNDSPELRGVFQHMIANISIE